MSRHHADVRRLAPCETAQRSCPNPLTSRSAHDRHEALTFLLAGARSPGTLEDCGVTRTRVLEPDAAPSA